MKANRASRKCQYERNLGRKIDNIALKCKFSIIAGLWCARYRSRIDAFDRRFVGDGYPRRALLFSLDNPMYRLLLATDK